jgi:hypothetical protein
MSHFRIFELLSQFKLYSPDSAGVVDRERGDRQNLKHKPLVEQTPRSDVDARLADALSRPHENLPA